MKRRLCRLTTAARGMSKMRYEQLLASRYIRAQKRQSAFTVISILVAVAIITMFFLLYGVCMNCVKNASYASEPFHLAVEGLTDEQGEALVSAEHVRYGWLDRAKDGTVTAYLLFEDDIGDREIWMQHAAEQIGAYKQFLWNRYHWNNTLMMLDGIGNEGKRSKLQIFCIFFVAAVLAAFSLRLIIDTAFEISSKERERHYGVLQSIGATPEQIVRIITAEAMRLCLIAVPLGLGAGIVFAYAIYEAVLKAGLADLFRGVSKAKVALPFTVDPKMLLVAAAVGTVWVFLSAYGVGMRIVKKAPMEAIITRANDVKKVRKHTLSGLLFGISGSIASRNARRQKKRFVITVLALTVSITVFALFTTLTESVERCVIGMTEYFTGDTDFFGYCLCNNSTGRQAAESAQMLADSGLFREIRLNVPQTVFVTRGKQRKMLTVGYVNREQYEAMFGADMPVSYDELVRSGSYVLDPASPLYAQADLAGVQDELQAVTKYRSFPKDQIKPGMESVVMEKYAEAEDREVTLKIAAAAKDQLPEGAQRYPVIGALETFEAVKDEWFCDFDVDWNFECISAVNANYNAADLKTAKDWFYSNMESCMLSDNIYETKWKTNRTLASLRAGVLFLNVLIALAALINLLNIVSTGIANRRSELASLESIGMTDRQLNRMAVIECLQFTGAAAVIAAVICLLILLGTEKVLRAMIDGIFLTGSESEQTVWMLRNMTNVDRVKPMLRIAAAALTALAAGCITSRVMLRRQNTESLSDRIRGTEMQPDLKKSHLLRNSLIAAAGAVFLIAAGLRIYTVAAYRHDRKEYEKAGYLNLVDSNGFKMNVYSTGAEHGKHTIVGLAGMGVNSYPIVTAELNARLGKENTLVYPDRAGYGFSDDSYKSQSLEQVVEDYRTGLKNAGFEAPYVLMGHSYGSYYALWWQMKYPDEIEAIIFLDGTWLEKNECWDSSTINEFPSESDAYAAFRRAFLRSWFGLDRLPADDAQPECRYGKALFSEEQLALWDMTDYPEWSAAFLSELKNEPEATRELRKNLHPTDTPKLYFSTMYTCEEDVREYMEFQKADYEASGLEYKMNIETAAKYEWRRDAWSYQDMYENRLSPFLEQCGNCRLVSVGGDHGIFFAQKSDEVADTILDFLAETTG